MGNLIWNDVNNNGLNDNGEVGIGSVTVNLLDGMGNQIATQLTNSTGNYLFNNLVEGDYRVEVIPPTGYSTSTGSNGSLTGPFEMAPSANSDTDNDDNGTRYTARILSSTVTLSISEPLGEGAAGKTDSTPDVRGNYTVDFGLFMPASIGDRVWLDSNHNGQQDGGETGVAGVMVIIKNANGDVVATTTTASDGSYSVTNLIPGSYTVEFAPHSVASGCRLTTANVGADSSDSDANATTGATGSYVLTAGETNSTVDAGIYCAAAIGDTVWSDTNNNGRQDAGEPGVGGVTVRLLDANGAQVATTTTGPNGSYLFDDLVPGTYTVEFVKSTVPAGYAFVTPNQGEDAGDSDADSTTGRTATYTLVSGQRQLTVDAGLTPLVALGDFVWNDVNRNGQQESGELGVAGVNVRLLDSQGATLLTTVTGSDGKYIFENLQPGVYSVEFVKSTLPAGYLFTNANSMSDVSDSDADSTTGRTTGYALTTGMRELSVDAGIYLPAPPVTTIVVVQGSSTTTTVPGTTTTVPGATTTTVPGSPVTTLVPGLPVPTTTQAPLPTLPVPTAPTSGSIGGCVWVDRNLNAAIDPDERPIQGAVVVLRTVDGQELRVSAGDDCGYIFEGLAPGKYEVEISSSTNPTNGPKVRSVTLGASQVITDIDFGFSTTGVKGVQVTQVANEGLALTGAMSLLMGAISLVAIGFGGLLVTRRRTRRV